MAKEMATQLSILAWETPWTEEPGGQQSIAPQMDCQGSETLSDISKVTGPVESGHGETLYLSLNLSEAAQSRGAGGAVRPQSDAAQAWL